MIEQHYITGFYKPQGGSAKIADFCENLKNTTKSNTNDFSTGGTVRSGTNKITGNVIGSDSGNFIGTVKSMPDHTTVAPVLNTVPTIAPKNDNTWVYVLLGIVGIGAVGIGVAVYIDSKKKDRKKLVN